VLVEKSGRENLALIPVKKPAEACARFDPVKHLSLPQDHEAVIASRTTDHGTFMARSEFIRRNARGLAC
jgi:hypothetical protein